MKIQGWRQRFLASTRGKILARLRAESHTVNELAKALQLTDNAVRAHLASLERDGLIRQLGSRAGFRKPHVVYGITDDAEHLFPKAYGPLLNHVLAVFSRRLSPEQLQANLREVGYTAAQDYLEQVEGKSRNQRTEFALTVLESLGGNAVVQESDGKQFIRGNGCPLSAVTAHHPEACLMVEALLSKIVDRPVEERCRHGEAPNCYFEIA